MNEYLVENLLVDNTDTWMCTPSDSANNEQQVTMRWNNNICVNRIMYNEYAPSIRKVYMYDCKRLLNKGNTQKNKVLHWELLTFLLHIEHRFYYFYDLIKNKKIDADSQIITLLSELSNSLNNYHKAYYEKNIKLINKINMTKQKSSSIILKLLEKSSGSQTIILSEIRELFRLIQIGNSPILSIILEN